MHNKTFRERPDVREILNILCEYDYEYSKLYRPWDNTIFNMFLNSRHRYIDIEYFFRKKPIKLDIQNSCFEFTTPNGEFFKGDISSYQIMESMARLIQLKMDGMLKGEGLIKECTDMLRLQYNFPMLYLLQEGITDNQGWQMFLYNCIICFGQISLMMNLRTLELYGDRQPGKFSDRLQEPGQVFWECLERGAEMLPHFYLNLISGKNRWLQLCDTICRILNIPLFTYMLDIAIKEAEETKRCATDVEYLKKKSEGILKKLVELGIKKSDNIRLPLSEARSLQCDIGIRFMKKLVEQPEYIINPLPAIEKDDIPPLQGLDGRLTILPRQEKLWNGIINDNSIPLLQIANKLLYDTNLSCYQCWDGNDIMFPCKYFKECRNVVKNSLIDFCRNDMWRKFAKSVIEKLDIKKCNISTNY